MSIELKQRLVGVMVLLALAIIFLPSLFHRQDQRITVDTTSLIPPKPTVQAVVIEPAVRSNTASSAPLPEKAFQPPVTEIQLSSEGAAAPAPVASLPKPSLNAQGLPNAWVIQVGSFQTQARADELKDKLLKKYKSYTRAVNTSKGKFVRVFVGPYIDKSRAVKTQSAIDKTYRVKSQVLTFAPE